MTGAFRDDNVHAGAGLPVLVKNSGCKRRVVHPACDRLIGPRPASPRLSRCSRHGRADPAAIFPGQRDEDEKEHRLDDSKGHGRVVGVVYTANRGETGPYRQPAVENIQILCRAGSLPLTTMIETGRIDGAPVAWISQSAVSKRHAALAGAPALNELPKRSREVALLLCHGQSNKQIAMALGISAHTVKEHIASLCRKLSAHNRTELVKRLLTTH